MGLRERLNEIVKVGPVAGIVAIAALLPFERIPSLTAGGVNVRASQVALFLTIAWSGLWLASGRIRLPWRRPETLALAGFFAAAALSLFGSDYPRRSLMVLAFTAFTASLAVLMPALLCAPRHLATTRRVVLIVAAAVCLFGLWQFAGDMAGLPAWLTGLRPQYTKAILGFTRIQSTSAEPLYFADYLLLPFSLAYAWLLSGAAAKTRPWLVALLFVISIDIVLTASRGGYAGLAASAVAVVWMLRRGAVTVRRAAIALVAGLAAAAIAFLVLSSYAVTTPGTLADTFLKHVTTLTDGAAYVERADTSRTAIDAFRLHPIIGVGIGGYGPFVVTYAHRMPDAGWPIVNDEYLELLAETGVIGFLAFMIFIGFVFRAGARQAPSDIEPIRVGAVAALVGILVQYFTFSTLYVMHVWFAIGLVLACAASSRMEEA